MATAATTKRWSPRAPGTVEGWHGRCSMNSFCCAAGLATEYQTDCAVLLTLTSCCNHKSGTASFAQVCFAPPASAAVQPRARRPARFSRYKSS